MKIFYSLGCMAILLAASAFGEGPAFPTRVSITRFYDTNRPEDATTQSLLRHARETPSIALEQWGGIELPGGGRQASLMMAIAGKTAPDIGESWFHSIGAEIRNGFLHPLNEWIGEDLNGNGQIDDEEALWEPWKQIPPLWRRVATHEGKVYGIPQAVDYKLGIIFRTDLVRAAGLDPTRPPETWDEFMYWCRRITVAGLPVSRGGNGTGMQGIALQNYGFTFMPWVESAGGEPILQSRTSPLRGTEHLFPADATVFLTPEGEDLVGVEANWRADFSSEAALSAAALFHRLLWEYFLPDPETGEHFTVSEAERSAGRMQHGGRTISFSPEDVLQGVARMQGGQRGEGAFNMLGRGEVAMVSWFVSDLVSISESSGISPDLLSWFPFPKGPGDAGRKVIQVQRHFAVMYEGVGSRDKTERDAVWQALTAITDTPVKDNQVRGQVLSGLARFADPRDLQRLGYEEYLQDIPESIRGYHQELQDGVIRTVTEPYMGFWTVIETALRNEVLGLILSRNGEEFDFAAALREVERKANNGMMFQMSPAELDRHRPWARLVVAGLVLLMSVLTVKILRARPLGTGRSEGTTRSVYNPWMAWSMVLPAFALIALWGYYPLARGMVMAFQDYRVSGDTPFVGLDNFIMLFRDQSFWRAMGRTFYFVGLNMLLAFTAPIMLAVLLTDVPRCKILFRTLFFLPQMTSGLVIALLWKMMYDPTPSGFFNQMIDMLNHLPFVDIPSQQWLQDPSLAMVCVVIPTVWSSMGMASLVYLAALGSLPRELYEAAEIDGAGIRRKMLHITLPSILPLIIINFVGVFISTFQNMGNIFLMTFGGPGEATTVVGLKIWMEAYANLRFSMATAMAWVLGSLLIGFTYFQIRFLGKIEYRRAT